MRAAVPLVMILLSTVLAGCIMDAPPEGDDDDEIPPEPDRPVVVIAVVDSAFNPYHWDFLAEHMPQHQDDDPANDLPLDEDPAGWLPGHPGTDAFDSYTRLDLSLTPDDEDAVPDDLHDEDSSEWGNVQSSDRSTVNMHWIPGTKVVGYVNFGSGDGYSSQSHGTGTSSVSTGNIHGSCPECLIVFVNGPSEQANEWVLQQDWIDVQTNSWGYSLAVRDRLYAGSDTELQRDGSERGQTIFFSAGNGQANTFTAPNPTLWSSQEGPDWVVTVGAIHPTQQRSYSGHGKPADLSSIGSGYPSLGGATVTSEGSFGGTSNATPVTAGIYARALWLLREELLTDRIQQDGTIAQSPNSTGNITAASCGEANPDCAIADGEVHAKELREALFRSAEYQQDGWVVGLVGASTTTETDEMRLLAQGHGAFLGRMADDWQAESQKIAEYALGQWHEEQDPDQRDWMIALSWCRQNLWGEWEDGYWNPEVQLPETDPQWPLRTWLVEECPRSGKMVHDIVETVNG